MRVRTTIRCWYSQIKRRWGALRARLRRERAALALLTLLTLGLGEPLLCIIHCQVWLPIAYHSYFATQHVHHSHHAQHRVSGIMPADAAPAPGTALMLSPVSANDPACAMPTVSGSGDGVPFHAPPSPVHDVLPAFLALFFTALLLHVHPAAPPGEPPRRAWPPPLRPPIRFAH